MNTPLQSSVPDRGNSPEDTSAQFSLIEPGELASRRKDFTVLEAHFSSIDHPMAPDAPAFRHIPGALQIHPSYLEAGLNQHKYYPHYDHPEEANILKGASLGRALEHLGINPGSSVVVYGSDPDGVMAAARLVWGLMYAGVKSVHLLDGGLDAWIDHGQNVDLQISNVWDLPPSESPSLEWAFIDQYLVTTPDICDLVGGCTDGEIGKLIDVRTQGEWEGSTPFKYPFFSRAGHIPGAIHQGDWGNLMDGSTQRLAPHLEVVKERWIQQGIIDQEVLDGRSPLTFYCGTGWRSSIAFLVAHLLGLRARNYEEGFFGWSHDSKNLVLSQIENCERSR